MGASMGSGGVAGGSRMPGSRRRRRSYQAMAEINVTPFVDVMLVLLIVFMVTAPLLATAVPVDLPKVAAPNVQTESKQLIVSVTADGKLVIGEEKAEATELSDLVPLLQALQSEQQGEDLRILVRGDRSVEYGRVLEVMGGIRAAGFRKVALVTQVPDQPR
ncbi:MAG: protein TolR [Alphaproteobacteria bacterium]